MLLVFPPPLPRTERIGYEPSSPLVQAFELLRLDDAELLFHLFAGCCPGDSRSLSWDLCYGFFYRNREQFLYSNPSPAYLDLGALELSSYLASFGMYRNKVLRTLNRNLFSAILQTLFEKARDAPIDPYSSGGILSVGQLHILIDAVKSGYKAFLLGSKYPNPRHPSVTFISKILMGVMGVLPAFDVCFKAAMPVFNSKAPEDCRLFDKLDDTSLTALLKVIQDSNARAYLNERFDALIDISEKLVGGCVGGRKVPYPVMRLLDLFFWTYGLKRENNYLKPVNSRGGGKR